MVNSVYDAILRHQELQKQYDVHCYADYLASEFESNAF